MRNEIRDKINYLDALQDILEIVDAHIERIEDILKDEEEDNGVDEYYSVRRDIWIEVQKFLEKKI